MFEILFTWIDAFMYGLPDWARISVWGLVLGALTMLLYGWLSPQERIAEVKEKVEQARREMREYTGKEFGPLWEKTKRTFRLTFRQLWIMIGPTLLAALPVILVLIWMEEDYKYEMPDAESRIEATVQPPEALGGDDPKVEWRPAEDIRRTDTGSVELTWSPPSGPDERRLVAIDSERALVVLPPAFPRRRIAKKSAWNWFFANPAGYLPDDAPVDSVYLGLPHRYVVPWGPDWLRTWHALFLMMLSISAVAVKVGFDID